MLSVDNPGLATVFRYAFSSAGCFNLAFPSLSYKCAPSYAVCIAHLQDGWASLLPSTPLSWQPDVEPIKLPIGYYIVAQSFPLLRSSSLPSVAQSFVLRERSSLLLASLVVVVGWVSVGLEKFLLEMGVK